MLVKIIRIHTKEVKSIPEAWKWLRQAKPEELEEILTFQTVKEIVPEGWVRSILKQLTGK